MDLFGEIEPNLLACSRSTLPLLLGKKKRERKQASQDIYAAWTGWCLSAELACVVKFLISRNNPPSSSLRTQGTFQSNGSEISCQSCSLWSVSWMKLCRCHHQVINVISVSVLIRCISLYWINSCDSFLVFKLRCQGLQSFFPKIFFFPRDFSAQLAQVLHVSSGLLGWVVHGKIIWKLGVIHFLAPESFNHPLS